MIKFLNRSLRRTTIIPAYTMSKKEDLKTIDYGNKAYESFRFDQLNDQHPFLALFNFEKVK